MVVIAAAEVGDTDGGLNVQVMPFPPEQVKVTVPVKPFSGETENM
jgi:hypothetical protein